MAYGDHVVKLLSAGGTLISNVTPYESASYTLLENDVGRFELVIPWINDLVVANAQRNILVEFWHGTERAFGGYIRRRQIDHTDPVPKITLSGPSYAGHLARRRSKVPAATAFDTYGSARLDDLAKAVVRRHVTAPSESIRQIPYMSVAADVAGSTIFGTYNARYETVLEAVQAIAKGDDTTEGDVVFDVIRNDSSGLLEFRTWIGLRGVDRCAGQPDAVIFDAQGGNVSEMTYIEEGGGVENYIYGGGTGEGAARMIREGQNAQSIMDWGRNEGWLDSGSDDTTAKLDLSILKHLAEHSQAETSLTFKISQGGRYRYGYDFNFGDEVTVIWKDAGIAIDDVIRGVTVRLAENNLEVEISVGTPNLWRLAPERALASFFRSFRRDIGVYQRH